MAMSTDDEPPEGEEVLPCGRTLRDVWEAWDDGGVSADPHFAQCPHCAAALDGLRALDGFVHSARSEDAAQAQAAEASGSAAAGAEAVAARVMEIVRLELRPGRTLPLGDTGEDAWIVEAAAAKTFRAAAEGLSGVRAGSCRIAPLDRGGVPPRGPVRVWLEVTGDLSRPVPELAEEVRARVTAAAREAVGLDVRTIDVTVIDVLTEEQSGEQAGEQAEEQSDRGGRPG